MTAWAIPAEQRPPSLRLRRGLVLLAGALVFWVVVGPGPDRFYLTSPGIGRTSLAILVAAVVGGVAARRLWPRDASAGIRGRDPTVHDQGVGPSRAPS